MQMTARVFRCGTQVVHNRYGEGIVACRWCGACQDTDEMLLILFKKHSPGMHNAPGCSHASPSVRNYYWCQLDLLTHVQGYELDEILGL